MMEQITKHVITLPFPPSNNSMFGGGSGQKRFKSKRYNEWIDSCPALFPWETSAKCHIHYTFYWPDNRVRDGANYMKAPLDYLVRTEFLKDDNWKIVCSENWDHGGIDKLNPRVELTITLKGVDIDKCNKT